jgi:hypothetical protein
MRAVKLVSPLTPDECVARLRAATDRDGLLSWFGSRPVVGRVSEGSVRLRKRIGYRNSFQTILTGSLEGCGGATLFHGRPGMSPLVTGFMAVWLGLTLLIGGVFVAALIAGRVGLLGTVIPPLMLAFGAGLVWFGRWLARGEEAFLVAFVAQVIGASLAPDAEPNAAADGGGM